jgi:hypothetical protein
MIYTAVHWQTCGGNKLNGKSSSQEICLLKTGGELSVIASGLSSGIASFPRRRETPRLKTSHKHSVSSFSRKHNLLIGDVQSKEMGLADK